MTIEAASARARRACVDRRLRSIDRRSSRTTARKSSEEPTTSRKSSREKSEARSASGEKCPDQRPTAQIPDAASSVSAAEVPRTPSRMALQRRKGKGRNSRGTTSGSEKPPPAKATAPRTSTAASTAAISAVLRQGRNASGEERSAKDRMRGVKRRLARASPRNHPAQVGQKGRGRSAKSRPAPAKAERAGTARTAIAPQIAKRSGGEKHPPPGLIRRRQAAARTALTRSLAVSARKWRGLVKGIPIARRIGTARSRNAHHFRGGFRRSAQSRTASGAHRGAGTAPR